MNKDNTFFQNLKQWSLKVSVSSIIFVSVMLLGGAIITLALPSSLDDVKSQNTHYQLNAENWDYVVDQISGQTKELTNLSGKVNEIVKALTDTTDILDEEGIANKLEQLDVSLKEWAENTFQNFTPKVTYYRGVFDNSITLGDGFGMMCSSHVSALSLRKLGTWSSSDIRYDYCGVPTTNDYYQQFGQSYSREAVVNAKIAVFTGTILQNHDMCSLAGVGGAFNGKWEIITTVKRDGKLRLYLHHAAEKWIEFSLACVDFSDKTDNLTFPVTNAVIGYYKSHCGKTPWCDAGFYTLINGETGDGCWFLERERAVVCIKQTQTDRKVGNKCFVSVVSDGSMKSSIGFKVNKGKVDEYGRCKSDGSEPRVSAHIAGGNTSLRDTNTYFPAVST